MRFLLLNLSLVAVSLSAGGCITYPADNPFMDAGQVRTFDREMADLKLALDRGSISHEEYQQAEANLRKEFDNGKAKAITSRELTPEQARKSVISGHATAQRQIHTVR